MTSFLDTFGSAQPNCEECVLLYRGVCAADGTDTCTCFSGYQDYLCRTVTSEPSVQSTPSTNWTIIVAVISAIAGLLLIIAVVICIFCIRASRRRRPQAG